MRRSVMAAVAAAGVLVAAGCPSDSELVEVRLFPCLVQEVAPSSLRVELQPFDEAGEPVGGAVSGVYSVEPGVFGDGYATLGYRPVAGAVTVDVQVWWYASEVAGPPDAADATSSFTGLPAPDAGQVMELGAEACQDLAGTDSTTTVGTTDGTDTTTTMSTMTSTSDDTESTTAVTATESTTDPGTTTDAGSTSGMGSTTDDTSGTSGGEEPSMLGEACGGVDDFFCEPRMAGGGQLLECIGDTWQLSPGGICPQVCGSLDYIGCAGEDLNWVCLCQDPAPSPCEPAVYNGCSMGNTILNLCVGGEEAVANCPSSCSYTDPDTYTCF